MRISDWSSDVCSSDLAGDADRDEDDSAQSFRDAGHDQGPYARLHRRDRRLPDGLLRPQPDRLAWRLLLSGDGHDHPLGRRSEEHTSELQSLMRISYAVFCLKKKTQTIVYQMHKHTH